MIREGKAFLLLANLALSSFQRRMGSGSGTKPGAEIHEYQPTPLDIVKAQSTWWFSILLFPMFIVFYISALAETNLTERPESCEAYLTAVQEGCFAATYFRCSGDGGPFHRVESTVGGAEIWASFCTVKLGLGA